MASRQTSPNRGLQVPIRGEPRLSVNTEEEGHPDEISSEEEDFFHEPNSVVPQFVRQVSLTTQGASMLDKRSQDDLENLLKTMDIHVLKAALLTFIDDKERIQTQKREEADIAAPWLNIAHYGISIAWKKRLEDEAPEGDAALVSVAEDADFSASNLHLVGPSPRSTTRTKATHKASVLRRFQKKKPTSFAKLAPQPDLPQSLYVHVVEAVHLSPSAAAPKKLGLLHSFCAVYVVPMDAELVCPSYRTPLAENSLNPVWNTVGQIPYQSVDDMMVIEVYDVPDKRGGDTLVGRTFLPISALVGQGVSSIGGMMGVHKWLPLRNPTALHQRMQGHVNVRVAIDPGRTAVSPLDQLEAFTTAPHFLPKAEEQVSVFVGTWNVGNASPPDDLSTWIPVGDHDIYFIGVQECKYQPSASYKDSRDDWRACLVRHFGKDYTLIGYRGLWEIRNAIFARNGFVKRISGVSSHKEATGVGGVMGNKGGVTHAFLLDHVNIGMVTAHLAAHQGQCTDRDLNYRDIIKRSVCGQPRALCPIHPDLYNQFHYLFFSGDLNYRVSMGANDTKSPTPEVFETMCRLSYAKDLEELLKGDQLKQQQADKKAFTGFKEADITFRPTFKVRRHTQDITYNPQRSPAFCDRVLTLTLPGVNPPTNNFYTNCEEINTSDHKPVMASYTLPLQVLPSAIDSTCLEFPFLTAFELRVQNIVQVKQRKLDTSSKKGGLGQSWHAMRAAVAGVSAKDGDKQVFNCRVLLTSNVFPGVALSTSLAPNTTLWERTTPSNLGLTSNNKERLAREHISIEVVDGNDDPLGHGILPLRSVLYKEEQKVNLNYAGSPAGLFMGKIKLEWRAP